MITQILAKVLPVLVMIILGRVCATKGILNDEQHAGLKNVIGDILLPVVLFQAFFTADYGTRMLLVFVLVFVGYGVALAAGYALRRFVKPYGRFMPLLMTNAEGGMLVVKRRALITGYAIAVAGGLGILAGARLASLPLVLLGLLLFGAAQATNLQTRYAASEVVDHVDAG